MAAIHNTIMTIPGYHSVVKSNISPRIGFNLFANRLARQPIPLPIIRLP